MTPHCRIDLRLLKDFGLSLNTKTKYHIVYDQCAYAILGVYDNYETAIRRWYNTSVEQYEEDVRNGMAYKGLVLNLSVWELLEHLTEITRHYIEPDTSVEEQEYQRQCVLDCIDKNMLVR